MEEQDGYKGRILPFELAQKCLLADELAALQTRENRLAQIGAELQELIENLSEEEKDSPAINEAGDGFATGKIGEVLQAAVQVEYGLRGKKEMADMIAKHVFAQDSLEAKLTQAIKLLDEEKKIKADIKTRGRKLREKTKATIESLRDEQARQLLMAKWIDPLTDAMRGQPENVIKTLTEKVRQLAEKYADTLTGIADDLKTTEREFSGLLGQLRGGEYDMQGIAALQKLLQG